MRGYRVFTWNNDQYEGDPKKFVTNLKKRGIKIVTIIDPGVKKDPDYNVYNEGVKKGYFVKSPDGTLYINKVWPGDSAFQTLADQMCRNGGAIMINS